MNEPASRHSSANIPYSALRPSSPADRDLQGRHSCRAQTRAVFLKVYLKGPVQKYKRIYARISKTANLHTRAHKWRGGRVVQRQSFKCVWHHMPAHFHLHLKELDFWVKPGLHTCKPPENYTITTKVVYSRSKAKFLPMLQSIHNLCYSLLNKLKAKSHGSFSLRLVSGSKHFHIRVSYKQVCGPTRSTALYSPHFARRNGAIHRKTPTDVISRLEEKQAQTFQGKLSYIVGIFYEWGMVGYANEVDWERDGGWGISDISYPVRLPPSVRSKHTDVVK